MSVTAPQTDRLYGAADSSTMTGPFSKRPDSQFLLASNPTVLQARAFGLPRMDPDRTAYISVTACFRPNPQSFLAGTVFPADEVPAIA